MMTWFEPGAASSGMTTSAVTAALIWSGDSGLETVYTAETVEPPPRSVVSQPSGCWITARFDPLRSVGRDGDVEGRGRPRIGHHGREGSGDLERALGEHGRGNQGDQERGGKYGTQNAHLQQTPLCLSV